MQQLLETIEGLRQTSGNAQITYLEEHKTSLLKDVLDYTLNTHKKYKIDESKFNKFYEPIIGPQVFSVEDWEGFKSILDDLAEKKSAKDEDIKRVVSFISNFDEEIQSFLKQVLFKDLRIGMGAKKIQKVWKDFCVTYPYMGCMPYNYKHLLEFGYPALAQTKMDGSFCNVIVDLAQQTIEYVSRQSKPQPIRGSLDQSILANTKAISKLIASKFVLTGEILAFKDGKPLPRKISNGILRRKEKTQEELDSLHLVCWDIIPFDKFIAKRWEVTYMARLDILKRAFVNNERIHIVDTQVINSSDEALALFNKKYADGEEGIVLKSPNQIWRDGKPNGQMKIKAEKTCELQMIAFEEGKGAYECMCGSITCIDKDNTLLVNLKPRTLDDAKEIWENQDKYIDKIVEVKFNEVIESDTKDKPSLYLPVFVEIRDDKNEADTLEYIRCL